jgi:demethylmenaquinone methyltransferase/2-methoxy-6-polyprenyl-1,4-benzoquinol methylase
VGRRDGVNAAGEVERDPQQIEAMFSRIARRYDLMNLLMTAGLDRRWRRRAAAAVDVQPGERVLDACCGTGDLALELARRYPFSHVTGLDFSEAMLVRARAKAARAGLPSPVDFVAGDLLALPFADDSFAAVTVAYGVRNVPELSRAFAEMARVTRSGGRVVCLEITTPPGGFGRRFHRLWFDRAVPALGRLVAGDSSAYTYLPASVRSFPPADELAVIMRRAGLRAVRFHRFGMGIIALHVGAVG